MSHAADPEIVQEEPFLIELSFKFNTPALQAAMGLHQREHLDSMNSRPDMTQADQDHVIRAMRSIFQK